MTKVLGISALAILLGITAAFARSMGISSRHLAV
jgi:hypothetical protein